MFQVKKISALRPDSLKEAGMLLEEIPAQPVLCNNWPEQYSYSPLVQFRIAHNDQEIFIRFDVTEKYTMARVNTDNGPVWTDSCVEFFIAPDEAGYYNCEFNCIGKALVGYRKKGETALHAPSLLMSSIKRYSTLGTENFEEKNGNNRWSLLVSLPVHLLFRHNFRRLSGLQAKANVYKCGDHLSEPHFLSWYPIDTPQPNFHVPQFFTDIEFQ